MKWPMYSKLTHSNLTRLPSSRRAMSRISHFRRALSKMMRFRLTFARIRQRLSASSTTFHSPAAVVADS